MGGKGSGRKKQPANTQREAAIVSLVAEGLTNEGIAERLDISIETVKQHLKNLFVKWEAKNRAHLTAMVLAGRVHV